MPLNPTIARVTERIIKRSEDTRSAYTERMKAWGSGTTARAFDLRKSGACLCCDGI